MAAPAQALQTAPVPPQNLDAEESVLGAMMLSPLAIGAVTRVREPDAADFYRESHGHIFKAILALYAKGEPVDAITVVDELDRASHARGGRRRRSACTSSRRSCRPRRTPPHYARIVSRDGDAARPDPRRQRHRAARLRPARRDGRARRPRRADRLRPLAAAGLDASSRTSTSCSRTRSRRSRSSTRPAATSPAPPPASATSTA